MAPYVTMKNIEMTLATAFTSPSATKKMAIIAVTKVAFRGSPLSLLAAIHVLIFLPGNDLSTANACMVRGATKMEPNADENVDAASPNGIITTPKMAMSDIMSWLFTISSGEAEMASLYITKK